MGFQFPQPNICNASSCTSALGRLMEARVGRPGLSGRLAWWIHWDGPVRALSECAVAFPPSIDFIEIKKDFSDWLTINQNQKREFSPDPICVTELWKVEPPKRSTKRAKICAETLIRQLIWQNVTEEIDAAISFDIPNRKGLKEEDVMRCIL
jgi:hypothetical protein